MSSQPLEHVWPTSGKSIGSVSASIFTSEDGKPDGKWKVSDIYSASVSNQDGRHPLVTGFVESVPGKFVGIVLSWRTGQDRLTTSWRNEEDLFAYYFLDGRPNPVMEYSILHPGAKNPLPLSGLWKSDDERFPLRWKRRPNTTHEPKVPSDTTFQPAYVNSSYPYSHALAQVDDLCSIRITIHNKDAETAANKTATKAAIVPNKFRLPHDPRLFQHERLSEALGIEAPKGEKPSDVDSLLNTNNDIPKSTPLIEFRIYYKSRSVLQNLQIPPFLKLDTKPLANSTASHKASPASLQPSNPSSSQQNHTTARRSAESAGLENGPAPKRVKREESEKQLDNGAGTSHDANFEESFAIPPPLATSASIQSALAEPSSSIHSASASKALHSSTPQPQNSHPLPQLAKGPTATQATPSAVNTQVTPSAVDSPAVGNISLSQSAGGADKKSQARAFLCELQLVDLDDEDAEETEEMVQALLSAGFSKKQRFLTNMRACDQATREGIFKELRTSMGALNFGVLLAYLKKNCGFE